MAVIHRVRCTYIGSFSECKHPLGESKWLGLFSGMCKEMKNLEEVCTLREHSISPTKRPLGQEGRA